MRRLTRREAVRDGVLAAGTLAGLGAGLAGLAGCSGAAAAPSGSTLVSTWADLVGDGQLRVAAGEPLRDRVELGRTESLGAPLATIAHVTDAHVLDASSPARVTFLDRLGAPLQSTFRPQEALTAQVLGGIATAVRGLRPGLVIQGGDLIDNDQHNELTQALAALGGGTVRPGSGRHGYDGVQSAGDADPFYYRPDLDAPRHPGLLRSAAQPFRSPGLGAPWRPVLGDHDVLVAGEVVPTALTRSLAIGARALWNLPSGLTVPPGLRASAVSSPDGPPDPSLVDQFLREALAGPTTPVAADPARWEMSLGEALGLLRSGSGLRGGGDRLDYTIDISSRLRVIVLDLVRRDGGSGGLVAADQPAWLEQSLAGAGGRWVIAVSHQPLVSSTGGEQLLTVLDRSPRVIAAVYGHTHRNRIEPRRTAAGGYWLISTASLIDYPQQARSLRVLETTGGGVAIQTWMLDHVVPGPLGTVARQLSYLDDQGGRPGGFAGTRLDRNVTLYRRAP